MVKLSEAYILVIQIQIKNPSMTQVGKIIKFPKARRSFFRHICPSPSSQFGITGGIKKQHTVFIHNQNTQK